MGSFSLWHWVVVLLVVILLFGAGKIPRLMGDMAKGINAFKKGLKEDDDAPAASNRVIDDAKPAAPVSEASAREKTPRS